MTYEMYDWLSLTLSGTLSKLKVKELDKYLERHNLSKKGKKDDKMKAIMADCLRKLLTMQSFQKQNIVLKMGQMTVMKMML